MNSAGKVVEFPCDHDNRQQNMQKAKSSASWWIIHLCNPCRCCRIERFQALHTKISCHSLHAMYNLSGISHPRGLQGSCAYPDAKFCLHWYTTTLVYTCVVLSRSSYIFIQSTSASPKMNQRRTSHVSSSIERLCPRSIYMNT